MSQFDKKMNDFIALVKRLSVNVDVALFTKVVKGLGLTFYHADASFVSSADIDELNRVKIKCLKED